MDEINAQTHSRIERFIPSGETSLVDDAPGWNFDVAAQSSDCLGPICWKCQGKGTKIVVIPNKNNPTQNESNSQGQDCLVENPCPVCQGCGRLAPKRSPSEDATKHGVITRGRKRPTHWIPSGPTPRAMTDEMSMGKDLVQQANDDLVDVDIPFELATNAEPWLPKPGEELCNLVGSWRILQRVRSHRWTTDDLCTAFVATLQLANLAEALSLPTSTPSPTIRYLDLGTGNASVLQMVSWAVLRDGRFTLNATGVEARKEAVELARRSLAFNVGEGSRTCRIVHADFRDFFPSDEFFDLITGTPPYFRVDFVVDDNNQAVTSAIIRQGGMPTAKQSAPARCEFRGGIEAYCDAAARLLSPDHGRFVVCENWLNHSRVLKAADQAGLQIIDRLDVEGRKGRGTLFCVYVMTHHESCSDNIYDVSSCLAVRDANGDWTDEYKRKVLQTMSIPSF